MSLNVCCILINKKAYFNFVKNTKNSKGNFFLENQFLQSHEDYDQLKRPIISLNNPISRKFCLFTKIIFDKNYGPL